MEREQHRHWHETNRQSWNAATPAHNSHKRDQAAFLKSGGSTLFPEEVELCGPLDGKRLVHLQCNCGQDTLSLARLGADVLGVDISDAAIEFATDLASETEIPARFVRSDLLDFFEQTEHHEKFDVAFATYGTIGWIADLPAWARGVAALLRPGGHLVLVEFHPLVWCFDQTGRLTAPYFEPGPLHEDGVKDYVAGAESGLAPMGFETGIEGFENSCPSVAFQWTVGTLVQAVADAELRVEILHEYPYANGCPVMQGMIETEGRRFRVPDGVPEMPLMVSLVARKPTACA